MSWQAWAALVLAVIALLLLVGAALYRAFGRYPKEARVGYVAAGFVAAVGLIVLISGMFTIVPTRQVGVVTAFAKPTGQVYDNGLHWKAPWANVSDMDAAIQIDKYEGDHRIKVRLGNSSTALADASIRWYIKQDAADELFVQYKTFDNVRTNLVERNLAVALNEVFASFDPLAPQNLDASPLPELATEARNLLVDKVSDQIEVLDVSVPVIDFDDNTEAKINQLNAERANTAVAEQSQRTAEAQKRANEILASSVSNDPNVVVSNCINKALDKGISPLGCWPGQGVVPTVPAR